MSNSPFKLVKGSIYQGEISSLFYSSLGVSGVCSSLENQNLQHLLYFPNTLPGDQISFRYLGRKKGALTGKVLSRNHNSNLRKPSFCSHFPTCGGCQIADLEYTDQLKLKEDVFQQLLNHHLPKIKFHYLPTIPCSNSFYYRNKMEFAFTAPQGVPVLGLKEKGKYDSVVPIQNCYIQNENTSTILSLTNQFFSEHPLPVWDYNRFEGVLRYLLIRHSKVDNTFLLGLIVSEDHPYFAQYARFIKHHLPSVSGVLLGIKDTQSDSAFVPHFKVLEGEPMIQENLGLFRFNISASSFFQTNTVQAEKLYEAIREAAQLSPTDLLMDLYCGTGTIGLFCAPYVKEVIGVEENPSSIENAKQNALLNSISNITFVLDNVRTFLKSSHIVPDVMIVDPPRDGLIPKVLRRILEKAPKRLIYVSCNPNTLCRDLLTLNHGGYTVQSVQAVDMFPHTWHLESIVVLTR